MKKMSGRFSGLLQKGREIESDSEPTQRRNAPAAEKADRDKGRSHPDNKANYVSTTVYIGRDVHKKAKLAMIEDDRELSELVEELLSHWLDDRRASKA